MRDKIRNIVIENLLNGKEVAGDQDLLISGMIDSLGVMRLVRLLEAEFDIKIPAEDVVIEHFGSINMLAAYMETRIST